MQNKNINNAQTAVFARSGLLKSKVGSMGSAENQDLRPLVKLDDLIKFPLARIDQLQNK